MDLEDKLWKVYLFGTQEEIDRYKENKRNNPGYDPRKDEAKSWGLYFAELGLPMIASKAFSIKAGGLIFTADMLFRSGSSVYKSLTGNVDQDASGRLDKGMFEPGLIGRTRELYQKYKKRN